MRFRPLCIDYHAEAAEWAEEQMRQAGIQRPIIIIQSRGDGDGRNDHQNVPKISAENTVELIDGRRLSNTFVGRDDKLDTSSSLSSSNDACDNTTVVPATTEKPQLKSCLNDSTAVYHNPPGVLNRSPNTDAPLLPFGELEWLQIDKPEQKISHQSEPMNVQTCSAIAGARPAFDYTTHCSTLHVAPWLLQFAYVIWRQARRKRIMDKPFYVDPRQLISSLRLRHCRDSCFLDAAMGWYLGFTFGSFFDAKRLDNAWKMLVEGCRYVLPPAKEFRNRRTFQVLESHRDVFLRSGLLLNDEPSRLKLERAENLYSTQTDQSGDPENFDVENRGNYIEILEETRQTTSSYSRNFGKRTENLVRKESEQVSPITLNFRECFHGSNAAEQSLQHSNGSPVNEKNADVPKGTRIISAAVEASPSANLFTGMEHQDFNVTSQTGKLSSRHPPRGEIECNVIASNPNDPPVVMRESRNLASIVSEKIDENVAHERPNTPKYEEREDIDNDSANSFRAQGATSRASKEIILLERFGLASEEATHDPVEFFDNKREERTCNPSTGSTKSRSQKTPTVRESGDNETNCSVEYTNREKVRGGLQINDADPHRDDESSVERFPGPEDISSLLPEPTTHDLKRQKKIERKRKRREEKAKKKEKKKRKKEKKIHESRTLTPCRESDDGLETPRKLDFQELSPIKASGMGDNECITSSESIGMLQEASNPLAHEGTLGLSPEKSQQLNQQYKAGQEVQQVMTNDGLCHAPTPLSMRLLCSGTFLEGFGYVAADLARGDIIEGRADRIFLIDSALIESTGVDIEAPSNGAMIVATTSQVQCSCGALIAKLIDVSASSRYSWIECLLCVDSALDATMSRLITRIQNGIHSDGGFPGTPITVKLTSEHSLSSAIANTICFEDYTQLITEEMEKWLSDDRMIQRIHFLLDLIPTLSVTGTLNWLKFEVDSHIPQVPFQKKSEDWFYRLLGDASAASRHLESLWASDSQRVQPQNLFFVNVGLQLPFLTKSKIG